MAADLLVTLALTVLFFAVVTPLAWINRLTGRYPIAKKPDRSLKTYWVQRTEPAQPKTRFSKRY